VGVGGTDGDDALPRLHLSSDRHDWPRGSSTGEFRAVAEVFDRGDDLGLGTAAPGRSGLRRGHQGIAAVSDDHGRARRERDDLRRQLAELTETARRDAELIRADADRDAAATRRRAEEASAARLRRSRAE
jgi:hypothetical protein